MKQNSQHLQDPFLQQLLDEGVEVNIFLSSGIKLGGNIVGYDPYVVLLEGRGLTQMVYKGQVSTVVPRGQFRFNFPDGGEGASARRGDLPLLQEPFLLRAMKERIDVSIFLANGIKRVVRVTGYDQYVVIAQDPDRRTPEMIYKGAIATIMPPEGFKFQREQVRETVAA